MRFVLAFLILVFWVSRALANDSEAELAVGGLVLIPSEEISLDKEDLFISKYEVRVDYVFTNTSDKDIETLVAFPLPEQGFPDGDDSIVYDLAEDLAFKTTVDGKPVAYEVVTQAMSGGQDVSQLLEKVGLRKNAQWIGDVPADASLKTVDQDALKALVAAGALKNEGTAAEPFYMQKWTVRTSVTRKQLFPAGKSIKVQHRYKPVAGGSVGGNFEAQFRKETWFKDKVKRYCIEDSWLTSLDKQVAKRPAGAVSYSEVWLGYILKSGANWKGPIKDFRVVIDKGKADSLVSFCGDGVKKISPTQFEMRKTDFEPDADLDVLVVEWMEGS